MAIGRLAAPENTRFDGCVRMDVTAGASKRYRVSGAPHSHTLTVDSYEHRFGSGKLWLACVQSHVAGTGRLDRQSMRDGVARTTCVCHVLYARVQVCVLPHSLRSSLVLSAVSLSSH
jgi:hypothetical protein